MGSLYGHARIRTATISTGSKVSYIHPWSTHRAFIPSPFGVGLGLIKPDIFEGWGAAIEASPYWGSNFGEFPDANNDSINFPAGLDGGAAGLYVSIGRSLFSRQILDKSSVGFAFKRLTVEYAADAPADLELQVLSRASIGVGGAAAGVWLPVAKFDPSRERVFEPNLRVPRDAGASAWRLKCLECGNGAAPDGEELAQYELSFEWELL